MERLGQLYDQNRRQARQLAEKSGWLMAVELRAVDVDFSFAPVLDLDRGICEVIGDRAIHSNPEIITILAHDYMHGMHQAGMAAVGKHFPGHGCVEADTHHAVATDQRHYEDIFAEDLLPYERMIQYGLAGVMTAHVVYPAIDSQPATFSSFWLRDVLRQRLGFQGVIFSDDLSMHAAEQAGDMPARVTAALAAGCDMVLVCNDRQGVIKVLDEPPVHDDAASHMRLVRMHGTHPLTLHELQQSARWMDTVREVLHYA
jgi:beta-N-acetylhexosaminidase